MYTYVAVGLFWKFILADYRCFGDTTKGTTFAPLRKEQGAEGEGRLGMGGAGMGGGGWGVGVGDKVEREKKGGKGKTIVSQITQVEQKKRTFQCAPIRLSEVFFFP